MAENVRSTGRRKARLRDLAEKLQFRVRRRGKRFTLIRTADVSKPVQHKALTLEQAEELLSTWKLRGFHGG